MSTEFLSSRGMYLPACFLVLAGCSSSDPLGNAPANLGGSAGTWSPSGTGGWGTGGAPFGNGGAIVGAGGTGGGLTGAGGVPIFGTGGLGQAGVGQGGSGQAGMGQGGVGPAGSGGDLGSGGLGAGGANPAAGGAAGASGASSGGASGAPPVPGDCSSLPPAADYSAKGPFADAKSIPNTGPSNAYTLFRPDASLGKDGFKHPIATWGNGITTTPSQYAQLLTTIASHGFVVIASNNTTAERPALSDGLDWLIQQNASGDMAGKLDITKELAIGYSWGGGAAIDVSDRPNILATVSFHGMPPRETDAFTAEHAPLLLFTSTGDTFVSASGYVTPNYQKSTVQTFYATLSDATFSHTSIISQQAGPERGPAIAWLRFWACHDENARKFFYGDDCVLCTSPFTNPQRKNWQ